MAARIAFFDVDHTLTRRSTGYRFAVEATRRLVQNIMVMVRSEVQPQQSYKNFAKAHLLRGKHNSVCRPVAVHKTV